MQKYILSRNRKICAAFDFEFQLDGGSFHFREHSSHDIDRECLVYGICGLCRERERLPIDMFDVPREQPHPSSVHDERCEVMIIAGCRSVLWSRRIVNYFRLSDHCWFSIRLIPFSTILIGPIATFQTCRSRGFHNAAGIWNSAVQTKLVEVLYNIACSTRSRFEWKHL